MRRSKAAKQASQFSRGIAYYKADPPKPVKPKLALGSLERLKHWLGWASSRLILAVVIILLAYFGLSLQSKAKLVLGPSQYRPAADYYAAIAGHLTSAKDRFKFSFDSKSIISTLMQEFPEIENATVELPLFGRQPVIRLDLTEPALILSGIQPQSYIVGSNGKVIGSSSQLLPIKNLPQLKDFTGSTPVVDNLVLSSSQIDFIRVVTAQLERAKVSIRYFGLPATPQEIDLYPKNQNYYVKLNLAGDPNVQTGSYLATLKYLNAYHVYPSDYIDVRVTGRVFYK